MPEFPPNHRPAVEDIAKVPLEALIAERDHLTQMHEIKGGPNRMPTTQEYKRLTAILKELKRRQTEPQDQKEQADNANLLAEAERILGRDNVHGPDDVELLLGFRPKNVPPIPYAIADLEKSKEIEQKTGVQEMLVLFANDRDGSPLTGEKLNALIQAKYTEMGLGKFLREMKNWYRNERFYKELGLTLEWKLVTKACIPNSYGKFHHFDAGGRFRHEDTQEYAIEQFALQVRIPREKFKRPEPFAMIYAIALHLVSTEKLKGRGMGERLLETKYHWSDVIASDRNFVGVGETRSNSVFINGHHHRYSSDNIGVCLSRDPS